MVQEWVNKQMHQNEELEIDSNLWIYERKYMNMWERYYYTSKRKHRPFNKLYYGNWFLIKIKRFLLKLYLKINDKHYKHLHKKNKTIRINVRRISLESMAGVYKLSVKVSIVNILGFIHQTQSVMYFFGNLYKEKNKKKM